MTCVQRSVALLLALGASIAYAAGEALAQPDPLEWVVGHWTQIVTAVAAFFLVYHVRRIDKKFGIIFDWKDDVDHRMGVHDQVWGHNNGCGPLWVHHRSDGASAIHFRSVDHPGLCERCKELQGRVIPGGVDP